MITQLFFRIITACCMLSALILLTSGCNRDNDRKSPEKAGTVLTEAPAYGDTLVEGTIGEASTLLPILATDASSHSVAGQIYNGLVKYDKNLNLVGDLAEKFDVSENGLKIVFRLRKNVKWHDGAPFTSRDVLYTYKVIIDPKTPTAYSEDFRQVSTVSAPDPYTFIVSYAKPFAPALASWGTSILPAHLLEGKDITKSELARKPVGTGPFRFREWVAGQKIVLEANHDYFAGRPYLDRYVFRVIPDNTTMYMELKAGGVDEMSLSPVQYARQSDTADFRNSFNKFRYPSNGYLYLGYNLRHQLFRDVRVRRALTAAINKDELVQGVLFGMGQKAKSPVIPGRWAYNQNLRDIPFDVVYAKKLLHEAGWQPGSNGLLYKDGKPFAFTILTNQGNQQRLMTAQIIQQRLRHIGIEVKIRVVEWAAFLKEFINKGNFEVVLLAWLTSQDPDMYDIWHSSKTKPGELNFTGYSNPEVDRLLEEGRSTFDIEKRKSAYFRIQEIINEEQPYTFLYVPDALPVVSSRFCGIEASPSGIGHNMPGWYVPAKWQRY